MPLPVVPLVVFVTLAIVYAGILYGTDQFRTTALLFLVSPDQLLILWCGGKLADFSLLDRAPIFLSSAVILIGAWLAGSLALDLLKVAPLLDRLERAVFAIAVGLNLLSLYALAVGLAGGLRQRWLFIAPLVALAAYGVFRLVQAWRQMSPAPLPSPASGEADERRWYWWLLAAAPYALVIVLGAMLPPWEYDVREYHLQVPKEWFQQGRIDFLPHNIYGNMPLGSELAAIWGMELATGGDAWWWGALAGKTVMACYSLVTAAGLIALGRRVHSVAAGVLAAVIYLSIPWTTMVAHVGYNEGAVGLYCLTAFHALWLAWHADGQQNSYRLTALAGFLAGAAVACKYPPVLFLVVPLTIWIGGAQWIVRQRLSPRMDPKRNARPFPWAAAILSTAIFIGGVTAGCGLWLAKNWALTGNPTYPLLYDAFGGRTRTPEKDRQWTRAHSPAPADQFSPAALWKDLSWILWRTKGASVSLLPLAALAWLATRQRGVVTIAALWLLFVFATWWLFTHRLDRFLVPVLPVVALLGGMGAVAMPHPAWRAATLALVVWGVVSQFPFVTLPYLTDNRFFAPLAGLRRDDLPDSELTGRRIDIPHRWLNANVPPGKRVLLVGDAEPFDLEMEAVYNTCFDDCQFARIFEGRTRAERLAILKDERISHVFFSWAHLRRYRSPGNYGYTSDYVTRELVHRELVNDQGLLRKIDLDGPELESRPEIRLDPELGELFEVAER